MHEALTTYPVRCSALCWLVLHWHSALHLSVEMPVKIPREIAQSKRCSFSLFYWNEGGQPTARLMLTSMDDELTEKEFDLWMHKECLLCLRHPLVKHEIPTHSTVDKRCSDDDEEIQKWWRCLPVLPKMYKLCDCQYNGRKCACFYMSDVAPYDFAVLRRHVMNE